MKLSYPSVFYHDEQEKVYVAVVPDLPGCSSGGDTFEEAMISHFLHLITKWKSFHIFFHKLKIW